MHTINDMSKEYKQLKLVIENGLGCLGDLDSLQITIQDHLETYHCDKQTDDDSEDE